MPKARVIHMDRIRTMRDAELKKLDVPFMKELEAGDTLEQQRIAELKQAEVPIWRPPCPPPAGISK